MVVKIGKRFVAATSAATIDGDESLGDTLTATPPTWFQDDVTTTDGLVARRRRPSRAPTGPSTRSPRPTSATPSRPRSRAARTATRTRRSRRGIAAAAVPAPEPAHQPSVTGTTQVGQTLTAHAAEWPLDR